MSLKKTILATLLLAAIGMFLSGCGGECPFKKIFGNKSSESKQPCGTTTAPADVK
jgi:hypothetical protein